MKKAAIVILVLVTAVNFLYSQNYKKTVFGVSAGYTVPYSDFAVKTIEYNAGFASPGLNLEIDLLRYAGRFLGLSANIGYASVFFNEKAYKAEYDRILAGYGQNNVSAGNYQVLKGVVGIILKIPETRHTEALLLFQFGAAGSVHPDLAVTNSMLGVINSVGKNQDWKSIAAMELKINYWLTEKYGISLNYSLNSTRPDFVDESGTGTSFSLPVKYMNINIGFVKKLKSSSE